MKKILTTALCLAYLTATTQTTADFENFNLATGTFANNAPTGAFESGNVSLPNTYSADFDFWSGWALSAVNNAQTPGFTNQYAAITGNGVDGSSTYAVGYALPFATINLTGAAAGAPVSGLYVTNSTYAYFSMLEGDSFAKRFGGETGDDPDFFLLTIKGVRDGMESTDSVNFYLADYRFSDNGQDYIVAEWTFIDLTALGNTNAINCYLSSSDNGDFGMNTPAYICVDNVITSDMTVSVRTAAAPVAVSAFPNPTTDFLTFQWMEAVPTIPAYLYLTDGLGRVVLQKNFNDPTSQVDVRHFAQGIYHYTIVVEGQPLASGKWVKM